MCASSIDPAPPRAIGCDEEGGIEALGDGKPRPRRIWNKIPDKIETAIVNLALEEPDLSPPADPGCPALSPGTRHPRQHYLVVLRPDGGGDLPRNGPPLNSCSSKARVKVWMGLWALWPWLMSQPRRRGNREGHIAREVEPYPLLENSGCVLVHRRTGSGDAPEVVGRCP
jgi:hypothetical protein